MSRLPLYVLFTTISFAAPVTGAAASCEKFSWSPAVPQKLLQQENKQLIESGARPKEFLGQAITIKLAPLASAGLQKSPERAPKDANSFAGKVQLSFPTGGVIMIALTNNSWIDVIQNDRYLRPSGNAGAEGCPGIRKIVKFKIESGETTVQFSGSLEPELAFVISPESN